MAWPDCSGKMINFGKILKLTQGFHGQTILQGKISTFVTINRSGNLYSQLYLTRNLLYFCPGKRERKRKGGKK